MPATSAAVSPRSAIYRRRQPERPLLYRTVQTHVTTCLVLQAAHASAASGLGVVNVIHRIGAPLNAHLHFHCR